MACRATALPRMPRVSLTIPHPTGRDRSARDAPQGDRQRAEGAAGDAGGAGQAASRCCLGRKRLPCKALSVHAHRTPQWHHTLCSAPLCAWSNSGPLRLERQAPRTHSSLLPFMPPQAAGAAVAGAAKSYKLKTIDVDVSDRGGDHAAGPDCLTSLVAAALTGLYEGNVRYRSKPEPKAQLTALQLLVAPHRQAAAVEAAARGVALAQGTLMARWADGCGRAGCFVASSVCSPTVTSLSLRPGPVLVVFGLCSSLDK